MTLSADDSILKPLEHEFWSFKKKDRSSMGVERKITGEGEKGKAPSGEKERSQAINRGKESKNQFASSSR